ncbi:MAG: BT4734/BF3469 family protein [Bacteroides cellulosilyticus]
MTSDSISPPTASQPPIPPKGELPSVHLLRPLHRWTPTRQTPSEYNGEIVLDLDKNPRRTGTHLKGSHRKSHTHISFTSPKGNGYKLTTITSLPDGTLPQSSEEVRNYHAHAYDQVAALYEELCQTDIDESGKDMTRICYLPHDENVYPRP